MAYASPMNRASYANQFDREIAKMVYAKYADYPKEWDKIAKVETWRGGKTYTEAEISGLGQLRQMGEGESISYDVPAEGHKKSIRTVKFGLGFQRTEEMGADELFQMSKKIPDSLAKSAVYCAEQNFWNLFNNAETAASGGGTSGWDGDSIPLLSDTGHVTMKSGTTIDNLIDSDLSQSVLEAAFEYYDKLVDEAGMPIIARPTVLVVPTGLKWLANDLSKATGRVWDYTNRNLGIIASTVAAPGGSELLNGLNPSNGVVDGWKVHVSRYITGAKSWFLLSDQHDMRFYWQKKPTMSTSSDFDTDNQMFKMVMRFAVAAFDYKGICGRVAS